MTYINANTSLKFGTEIPRYSQFHVVSPPDQIPPFQIRRASNTHGIADITIEAIPASGIGTPIDIVALMDVADPLEIVAFSDGTDAIVYKQTLPLTADLSKGNYYIKVSDTVTIWYSQYIIEIECGELMGYPDMPEIGITDTDMDFGL